MKKFVSLLLILVLALSLGVSALADTVEDAERYLDWAESFEGIKDFLGAACGYEQAAYIFKELELYQKACDTYAKAKSCYEECDDIWRANDMQDQIDEIVRHHPEVVASTLSEGSLAIVTAIAGVAVGLAGGYFLFGRKKKSAEA